MKYKEKGQSLVEAIIALTAAILVVSSIIAAVIIALNNAQYSKYQNLATQYAQEGIEVVKKISVANWASFILLPRYRCLDDLYIWSDQPCIANVYGVGTPQTKIFRRSIEIEQSASDCNPVGCSSNCSAKVISTVSWSDSKCTSASDIYCHSVVLKTC